MTQSSGSLHAFYRPSRLAAIAVFCGVCVSVAHGQIEDDAMAEATPPPPYTLFQYSTLTGSGSTVTATWVPIVNSAGKTTYENVTIQFAVSANGALSIAPGYPKIVPTPPSLTTSFKGGKYVGPSTVFEGTAIVTVSGPGVAPGGATEWSLAAAKGAYPYTYPGSATWYAGQKATSPIAARLTKAGITSTAWSYGIGGGCLCSYGNGGWYYANSLLGFSQTANTLTIVSFTDESGADHNQPVSQIIYTLVQ